MTVGITGLRGRHGGEAPPLSPTWYHCDGFQGTEDTEGPESRDVPQVHKLGNVAVGQEREELQGLCLEHSLFLQISLLSSPSHRTHAMEMTMKSSQFHGSRRNVKSSMQKPLDRILMRDSKV